MPIFLNSNIGAAIGLANETFGKAKGVILDPTSVIYRIKESNIVVVTKPPICVLVEVSKPKHQAFEGLEPTIVPVFPTSFEIDIQNGTDSKAHIKREQVPCSPAFATSLNYHDAVH